jgi:hypothetical protein
MCFLRITFDNHNKFLLRIFKIRIVSAAATNIAAIATLSPPQNSDHNRNNITKNVCNTSIVGAGIGLAICAYQP